MNLKSTFCAFFCYNRGGDTMNKKRKLNKKRLLTLMLIPIVVIAGIAGGYHIWDRYSQDKRHEFVQSLVNEYEEVFSYIKNYNSEYVTEDSLQTLIELADEEVSADFTKIKKWNKEDVRIDKEVFEKLQDEKSPKSNSYYKLLKLIPSMEDDAQNYVDFVLREPESRVGFALEYKNRNQYMDPVEHHGVSLSTVPSLLQWDPKWGFMEYGDTSLCFTGCAPTCLSMVFSYLNQDDTITPTEIASFSVNNGMYVEGVGTSHALLDLAAREYDIQVEGVSVDHNSLVKALEENKICILSVNPGDFTSAGHFIVVYGMKDGKLQVRDPNSKIRTEKLWDVDRVVNQTRSIWSYSKDR